MIMAFDCQMHVQEPVVTKIPMSASMQRCYSEENGQTKGLVSYLQIRLNESIETNQQILCPGSSNTIIPCTSNAV